eukprot:365807-Chlamydomonas_euryale.AAC.11
MTLPPLAESDVRSAYPTDKGVTTLQRYIEGCAAARPAATLSHSSAACGTALRISTSAAKQPHTLTHI